MKIQKIINKETLMYIVFGAATTVVNYAVFYLLYHVCFGKTLSLLANALAFVVAVVFAFVVNKCFVFENRGWSWEILRKEIMTFLAARVGSFGIEEAGLLICEVAGLSAYGVRLLNVYVDGIMIAKLALSVFVVVVNYVLCKWFIFKK